ncbi:MAG: methyl-accepting chemotaxis protein [Pseudomonadota bacterium]
MSLFISPAVAIANRMSFSAKLSTMVLIFLIPLLVVLGINVASANKKIQSVDHELKGMDFILKLKPLALEVAKHRGNMAQHLAGAVGKDQIIKTIELAIDDQLLMINHLAEKHSYSLSDLADIGVKWKKLKISDSNNTNALESFAKHSTLIELIHRTIALVANDFQLTLQQDNISYYLMDAVLFKGPELQEGLGKLRGKGAAALADKSINVADRITLGGLLSSSQVQHENLSQNILLLYKDNDIKNKLNASVKSALVSIQDFFDMLGNQVLAPEEPQISNSNYFDQGTKAIASLADFDKTTTQEFVANINSLKAEKVANRNGFLMTGLVCILIGLYLALGILSSLTENASQLNNASHQLQKGNFAVAIMVDSQDTLGDAAKSLTTMIASVAELLNGIKNSAHDVNTLSMQLQLVTDASKDELDQQNSQTQQSASAATEMAATVRDVARNCVDAASATESARAYALDGQYKVNEAITKINTLGADVERARDIIGDLQADVTDIGAVLEVIRSIADQTNLLALNAAIEAARAGEQGRGFAVVADEVRSLAKRTQDSTAEIRTVIETLQGRAANAVSIIQQGFVGANESVSSAASAGASLDKIVLGVETLRDLNIQIAAAAEQQSAVAEQMSRNTQHLSDSAENILEQVEETVRYTSSLRKSALSLLENSMKFTT